jgi:hypothetical protein
MPAQSDILKLLKKNKIQYGVNQDESASYRSYDIIGYLPMNMSSNFRNL